MLIALLILELCKKQALSGFVSLSMVNNRPDSIFSRDVLVAMSMFCLTTAKLNQKHATQLGGCLLMSSGKNIPLGINN